MLCKQELKEELKRVIGEEPIFYLKFTREECWAKDVINGNFFMNTVQYFRDLEEKMLVAGQGDKNELKQQFNLVDVNIINEETNGIFASFPTAKLTFEIKGDNQVYLYCITGITLDDLEILEYNNESVRLKLPFSEDDIEKIKADFGDNVVVISGRDFRNRIYKKINKEEIDAIFGKVTYCKHNSIQRIDAYNKQSGERFLYKDSQFKYQKESRIAVTNRFIKDNRFNVGSIEEFSSICKVEDFIKCGLKIRYVLEEI